MNRKKNVKQTSALDNNIPEKPPRKRTRKAEKSTPKRPTILKLRVSPKKISRKF